MPFTVTVWGENVHEQKSKVVADIYPNGMHEALAQGLRERLGGDALVRTATLQEPEHGLTEEVLATTDVLTWWGHAAHAQVDDGVAARVQRRVLDGMSLIVLHSGHLSKPFRLLMGTSCNLRWREASDREVVWVVHPTHPIARGIGPAFVIPEHEMYGEYFDIPVPDELIFISSFTGGEVFRGGCVFRRGNGMVFYFSPGHETYPIYYQPEVLQVVANASGWLAATTQSAVDLTTSPMAPPGWYEGKADASFQPRTPDLHQPR